MVFWIIAGLISLAVLAAILLVFFLYACVEKEKRAATRSGLAVILVLALSLVFSSLPAPWRAGLFGAVFVVLSLVFIGLLLSGRPNKATEIIGPQERIDERDVIFARFDMGEATANFRDYYARRPERRKIDDEIRALPDILASPHLKKNPILFTLAAAEFGFLEHQISRVAGKESSDKVESSPPEKTRMVKSVLKYLGADACGICLLNPAYIYSHGGRGPDPYGAKIDLRHAFAIVFALEMDTEMVAAAPAAPVIVETGKKYVEAARISIIAADLIRRLGFPARAHVAGSNYQAVLPPIAWEAGLGEVGRLGVLITWKYGPRARLGLITTGLPLVADRPEHRGVLDFCEKCRKCALLCPAQAIPRGDRIEENGSRRWILDREACYKYWRKAGTDCAVCLHVCPYSKPSGLLHDAIRRAGSRWRLFQTISAWGDDVFYGKNPIRKKSRTSLSS